MTKTVIALLSKYSKKSRGWGYTVEWKHKRSAHGKNAYPEKVFIDTLDDLLRLGKKTTHWRETKSVVDEVRARLPQTQAFEEWLKRNICSLAQYHSICDELILVTQYFLKNPRPGCYARSLPVRVESKFVEQNEAVLKQWLDALLPDSKINVNGSNFAQRFGLKERQKHRGIQLLDPLLVSETGLTVDGFSLPIQGIDSLDIESPTIFVVENEQILNTMPNFPRGIGVFGEGNAANLLAESKLLRESRLYYWGDIDLEGMKILSRFRERFPRVESILMDVEVLHAHRHLAISNKVAAIEEPANLTPEEAELFRFLSENELQLEQEKLQQAFVNERFAVLEKQIA